MKQAVVFFIMLAFSMLGWGETGASQEVAAQAQEQAAAAENADPAVTLRAPFSRPDDMAMPTAKAMGLTYWADVEDVPLSSLAQPHRGGDQVAEWLVSSVSEILDTDAEEYPVHLESLKRFMDKSAITGYNKFMQESRISDKISMEKLHIHAFVEEKPFLLNKGVVEGRYRWLYDVPATLTFMKIDIRDYQNSGPMTNYRLLIRMQIGRIQDHEEDEGGQPPAQQVRDDSNEQGLIIETWEVRKNTEVRG